MMKHWRDARFNAMTLIGETRCFTTRTVLLLPRRRVSSDRFFAANSSQFSWKLGERTDFVLVEFTSQSRHFNPLEHFVLFCECAPVCFVICRRVYSTKGTVNAPAATLSWIVTKWVQIFFFFFFLEKFSILLLSTVNLNFLNFENYPRKGKSL